MVGNLGGEVIFFFKLTLCWGYFVYRTPFGEVRDYIIKKKTKRDNDHDTFSF